MRILLLFIIASCSSQNTKIITYDSSQYDAFSNESLSGYSQARIEKNPNQFIGKEKKLLDPNIMEANKNNFLYWNALGNYQLSKGQYSQALYNFKLALGQAQSKRDKAIVYNNQGILHYHLGHLKKAVILFQESVANAPSSLTPNFNLAISYQKQGFNSKGLKILGELHRKNPQDLLLIRTYGNALIQVKKNKQALVVLNRYPNNLVTEHKVDKLIQLARQMNKEAKKTIAVTKR